MGAKPSTLKDIDVKVFKSRTFFEESELRDYYTRFEELGGSLYDPVQLLPLETIVNIPSLQYNPLRYRIAEVFCSSREEEADPIAWSFDDFLQFHNAFSARSSLLSEWINTELADLKIYWAFRIFDFNDDNAITQDDLAHAVQLMVGDRKISREEVDAVAANIIRECDQDDSRSISRTEFKRALQRIPDFQWHFAMPDD